MARLFVFLAVATLLGGCARQRSDLMPVEVGKSWTYHVVSGLDTRVESVRATRPVAVGGVEGVELNGPLGVSRLAWTSGGLVAESTSNLRFRPPLTLLTSNDSPGHWKGWITWMGREFPGTADMKQAQRSLTVDSRLVDSTESDVVLNLPSRSITLSTWFEPGVGIVRQEQHTGNRLDIALELVEGP